MLRLDRRAFSTSARASARSSFTGLGLRLIRAYAAARATNVAADYAAEHWLHNTGMVVLEGTPLDGWEMTRWVEDPLGGRELIGVDVEDPTGAPEHEVVD